MTGGKHTLLALRQMEFSLLFLEQYDLMKWFTLWCHFIADPCIFSVRRAISQIYFDNVNPQNDYSGGSVRLSIIFAYLIWTCQHQANIPIFKNILLHAWNSTWSGYRNKDILHPIDWCCVKSITEFKLEYLLQ